MIKNLYRSADGRVIHADGCRHANPARRWAWADDKTRPEVAVVVLKFDYRPCRMCKPLGGAR